MQNTFYQPATYGTAHTYNQTDNHHLQYTNIAQTSFGIEAQMAFDQGVAQQIGGMGFSAVP